MGGSLFSTVSPWCRETQRITDWRLKSIKTLFHVIRASEQCLYEWAFKPHHEQTHTHTHTKRRAWWHRQQSNEWRTPIMHIVQIQNCAVLLSTDMRCHQGSRPHCLTSPSLKICRSTSRTSTHTLNHPCNYSLWNAGNSCVKHMSPWKVLEFNSQKVVQAWNES